MAKYQKKGIDNRTNNSRPQIEFKNEWCDMLIKHMSIGLSFESFAGVIGVCKETLYNLTERNIDFLDAKKKGKEKCRLFWERMGVNGAMGNNRIKQEDGTYITLKGFSAVTWIMNMKNRFSEEWKDRQDIDHTTKGEKITNEIDISKLSPSELKIYTEISRKLRE